LHKACRRTVHAINIPFGVESTFLNGGQGAEGARREGSLGGRGPASRGPRRARRVAEAGSGMEGALSARGARDSTCFSRSTSE
jgi:hypothetical protein